MNDTLWLFLFGPWEWMTAQRDEGTQWRLCVSELFLIIFFDHTVKKKKGVTLTQWKKGHIQIDEGTCAFNVACFGCVELKTVVM